MRLIKLLLDFIMDTLETIVFIGTLYIVVYLYLFAPSSVQGASMEPNLHSGDRIINSKISYKLHNVERGDIVIVKSPANENIHLIKRVIGLPGETISVQKGKVFIGGELLEEEYISVETDVWENSFLKEEEPYKIEENYYFVIGDNRPRSADSRMFGPVHKDTIMGKAIYRYFPPTTQGVLKNPFPENLRE